MHYELALTAVADRDPSCNLFTLTRTHNFPLSSPPTSDEVRDLALKLKDDFKASWPHRRQTVPMLIPIDAEIREVDA